MRETLDGVGGRGSMSERKGGWMASGEPEMRLVEVACALPSCKRDRYNMAPGGSGVKTPIRTAHS